VPATTPVQPNAPIMKARTKAITGQPLADAIPEEPEPEVELPQADGPLSVGDDTLMVRPVPAARGKQIALVIGAAVVAIGAAFLLITRLHGSDDDDPRTRPNPNIKLPPQTNVPAAVVTPDAAEEYEEIEVDDETPDPPVTETRAGSDDHGTIVKLRDGANSPAKKKKKKILRRRPVNPPTDQKWDPNGLFPKQ
jgi:hypothetical protein